METDRTILSFRLADFQTLLLIFRKTIITLFSRYFLYFLNNRGEARGSSLSNTWDATLHTPTAREKQQRRQDTGPDLRGRWFKREKNRTRGSLIESDCDCDIQKLIVDFF